MPKLARKPVEKKKMDQLLDNFWEAISLFDSRAEVEGFFHDLLTHTERKMLAKRFQVVLMLLEGLSYEMIRSELNVGDQTIARINNWLNTGANDLVKVSKRLISQQRSGRSKRASGKYLAGDLLSPAIEEGLNLAAKKLSQRRQRK